MAGLVLLRMAFLHISAPARQNRPGRIATAGMTMKYRMPIAIPRPPSSCPGLRLRIAAAIVATTSSPLKKTPIQQIEGARRPLADSQEGFESVHSTASDV